MFSSEQNIRQDEVCRDERVKVGSRWTHLDLLFAQEISVFIDLFISFFIHQAFGCFYPLLENY